MSDEGLFYVRTWIRGTTHPHEEQFTSLKKAEAAMKELSADRAYARIEFLVCREWMTRDINHNAR